MLGCHHSISKRLETSESYSRYILVDETNGSQYETDGQNVESRIQLQ